jgi:hypothetical protein
MFSFFKRIFNNPFTAIKRVERTLDTLVKTKNDLTKIRNSLNKSHDKDDAKILKIEAARELKLEAIVKASLAARNIATLMGD